MHPNHRTRPVHVPRKAFPIAVLLTALLAGGVQLAHAALPSNVTVTFNGATYNYGGNTTTFSYDVSVAPGSGAALSHLTLGACADVVPNGTGSGPQNQNNSLPGGGTWRVDPQGGANICEGETIAVIVGTDPTTGVRGVKYECAGQQEFQEKGDTATYSYTVSGIWSVDDDVPVGAKAGAGDGSAAVGGPDCDSIDLAIGTDCADFSNPNPVYTSTITNRNGNVATNVVFTDFLPKDVAWKGTYSSACPSCGTVACTSDAPANPETVTCTLSELAAGATWTIGIDLIDNTSGPTSVEHVVAVEADEVEQYTDNNDDACATTTPVTVSYFLAVRRGDGVRFEWSTSTETGNVGFYISERSSDGTWRRLNDPLVASKAGDSLSRLDYVLESSGAAGPEFRVEDVDVTGQTRFHGPFELGTAYGMRSPERAIDWAEIRSEHERKLGAREAARQALARDRVQSLHGESAALTLSPSANPGHRIGKAAARATQATVLKGYPAYDVLVDADGIHRVTFAQLKSAGLDMTGVPPSAIALLHRGRPVPIRVVTNPLGRFDHLEFHGEAAATIYTRTNVYRLVVDPAVATRMARDTSRLGWAMLPVPHYMETVAVEHERQYSFAAPNGDPWFDERLLAFRSPVTWSFTFDADGYLPGLAPASLSVDMNGVTDWPGADDHHVVVSLNGIPLADERFDGLVHHPVSVTLPEGVLLQHGNRLDITLPGDSGYDFDLVHLNAYGVRYPRAFFARADALAFTAVGPHFEVAGFSSPDIVVYRVVDGVPALVANPYVTGVPGAYRVRFMGSLAEATYYVRTSAAAPPARVRPAPERVDIKTAPAQFLILSHPDFVHDLERLVRARTAQGLVVEVVSTENVYDQFGHGLFDPSALKAYIAHAKAHKGTEAVLLVGGDTYDYLDHLGQGAVGFVPSLYAATDDIVDFAPVDPLFADVDGDLVPDLPIGRFPVRTSEELAIVIDKTLAYGAKTYGRTAVFAADAYDGSVSYAAHSEEFIAELPGHWDVARAYIDDGGVVSARKSLLDELNKGVALASFTGHSSLVAWTYKGLLNSTDVASLTNHGRPAVVTQWGCWNTYFVSPSFNTMGHKFMVSGDIGAAAVLGASTLTSSTSERRLGSLVIPRLTRPGMTIGQAIQSAKAELAKTDPTMHDVLLGWTLLGDPYLVVEP